MFRLGAVDPLYVIRFSGFDHASFVSRVRLLGDGTAGPHEILQGSGTPMRDATLTGHIADRADLDLLRGYARSKETLAFRDGNDRQTQVVVLELGVEDETDWWTFSMTLVAITDDAGVLVSPDPVPLVVRSATPTVTAS